MVALQRSLADGVQLVQECRHKASGSADITPRACIFGCDLVHEDSGEDGEQFVGWVGGQETTGDGSNGASGLFCQYVL